MLFLSLPIKSEASAMVTRNKLLTSVAKKYTKKSLNNNIEVRRMDNFVIYQSYEKCPLKRKKKVGFVINSVGESSVKSKALQYCITK